MPYKDLEKKRLKQREYCARPEVKAARKSTHAKWLDENRDRKLASEATRRLDRRASVLVATVRTRARKRGLEFNLDQFLPELQARIDLGLCEVTGEPFDLSPGRKFSSPSLDRIDPKKGYTFENTRIVLNLVNAAMGDWGEEVLAEVMTRWLARRAAA